MSGYGKDCYDGFVATVGAHLEVAGLAGSAREGAEIARLGHVEELEKHFSVDEADRDVAALRCAATIAEVMSGFNDFAADVGTNLANMGHANAWHEAEAVARGRYLDDLVKWFGGWRRFGRERCASVCAKVIGRDLRKLYAATNYPRM